mgnify:CR=1 FL=1
MKDDNITYILNVPYCELMTTTKECCFENIQNIEYGDVIQAIYIMSETFKSYCFHA